MGGEKRQVLEPRSQGRQRHANDVESIPQILAKAARFDLAGKRSIGGRDNAHVDAPDRRFTEAPHFAFLQRSKQLRLHARAQLRRLVEKQRTAVGVLEKSRTVGARTCERTPCVSEELGFDEIVDQRRAINGAEALVAPDAARMDGACR
jgi:hypothetical protein